MTVIVDAGIGNYKSIQNMIHYIGYDARISRDPKEIEKATRIIIPGVGSFDAGMRGILNNGLYDVLNEKVLKDKTPCLGICLGMQLMMDGSEEGNMPGFGWIKGYVHKFDVTSEFRVPHIGWNYVESNRDHYIVNALSDNSRFYFVHSYYVKTEDVENTMLWTDYGIKFASAINNNNIIGVQFHPEKSHKYGMQLFKSFMEN